MKTIAVHSGKFHADDVFAAAILKLIYPELKVIRTRNPEKLKDVDARVDVGGVYDPKKMNYDHHQQGDGKFSEKKKNGIPYAAAGLIWKHYGEKLVSSKKIWDIIEDKIIQYIDADDNGIRTHQADEVEPYSLGQIIQSFNPEWPNRNEKNYDKGFEEVLVFVMEILKREIEIAESGEKAREIIKKEIAKTDKEYLVLEENLPFQDLVREESDRIKFVIKGDPVDGVWAVIGVKKEKNSFDARKDFPEEWGGLSDGKLVDVTGVKDAVFCHKKLFIVVAKSREGAIKLVELALKNGK